MKIWHLLWASPCSAIGLVFAMLMTLRGGTMRWSKGALEVCHRQTAASCGRMANALPFRAIVFGHVILAVTQEELQILGDHERVHVAQYAQWGPLFFAAYSASALWQLLRGRSPYWDNYFEIQARKAQR